MLRPGDILEGRLDTYLITATINRGSYGCAFRARTADGAWRVVKQFEPSEELAESDHAYQRRCFEREADILMRFRSPLMVRGYELIERDHDMFFVMEHVQGQTLRAVLDEHHGHHAAAFDVDAVVGIGVQLCTILDGLHRLPGEIIYRDLKPSNIMWDAAARRIKLIDFGTARFNAIDQQATQGLGTEGYAPPELYGSGARLSPATDVYTIGAVLYELIAGRAPEGRTTPAGFGGREDELPPALTAAVLQALQQDPIDRFPTAAAFREALQAAHRPGARPPLQLPLHNQHPLLACFCPVCGREPGSDEAIFCGVDAEMYVVALLQVVPRHRSARTAYLDRAQVTLGRHDPDEGRYPELDLTDADPARHVSRRHATLRRSGTAFELEVHATTNPTRLDGELLEPGSRHAVRHGSRIELGDLVVTLLLKPVVDPVPGADVTNLAVVELEPPGRAGAVA